MTELFFNGLFIFSFLGNSFLFSKILIHFLELKRIQEISCHRLFLYAVSWHLTLGYLGVISSLFFCFDFNVMNAKWIFIASGITGLLLIVRLKPKICFNLKGRLSGLSRFERILLGAVVFLLLNYFYRAFAPWWDEDETTKYGYFSKLIANGWTFSDFFKYLHEADTRFAESIFAQTFSVLGTNFISKLLKFLNLISDSAVIYFFLRFLNLNRVYGLLAVALFLGVPDLAYLGTSLKTDSTMMGFEICAHCFLLLSFIGGIGVSFQFLRESNVALKDFLRNRFVLEKADLKLLFLACVFAFFALAIRMMSLYLTLITTSIFFFFLLKSSLTARHKAFWTLGLTALGLTILHHYIHSLFLFHNPFYPVGPVWPFQKGMYDPGFNVSEYRHTYNLDLSAPSPLYQLYLLIHISLGFETAIYDSLKFLPHAFSKGNSLGWQTPTLLVFFILPFVFKRSIRFIATTTLFVILFLTWSHGLQYTRCFFATALLSIYLLVFILSEPWQKKYQRAMVRFLRAFVVVVLVFELTYQILFSYKKYCHSFLTPFSAQASFNATDKILKTAPWVDHVKYPFEFLNFDETRKLDGLLKGRGKIAILFTGFDFILGAYPIQAYFSNGLFVQEDLKNLVNGKTNELGLSLKDFNCALVKNLSRLDVPAQQSLDLNFPSTYVISEPQNIELKCL